MIPTHDLLGVGIGPFNLSLAALLDPVDGIDAVFFDQADGFAWHPGLLVEGTTTQVPFLADLVTLADPTSRHSFLEYLRAHDRLYRFYLRERFHLPRREYDHYCRWVAGRLAACRFGTRVDGLRWLPGPGLFEAELTEVGSGRTSRRRARNLVLGVGWAPAVPAALAGAIGKDVFHAAEFLDHRERLRQAAAITVVGSGQSGAEVFLELLGEQPGCGYRLDWLTRSAGFFPMEYSRLGLEHFTPDYTRYFHGLPDATRDSLLPTQDLLYKGIDVDTIAAIGDLLYERTVAGAAPPLRLLAHAEVRSLEPAGGRWRLAGDLLGPVPVELDLQLKMAAERLGTDRLAVAASALLEGHAWTLGLPLFAALATGAPPPDLAAGNMRLHFDGGRLAEVAVLDPAAPPGGGSAAVAQLVDGHLAALVARLGERRVRRGPRALWGLVANGCAAALLEQARAAGLPPARVARLLDQLLATPGRPLPAPVLLQVGPADDPRLVRRVTCCLNYTVAGQPCATCPLLPTAETRRRLADRAAPSGG